MKSTAKIYLVTMAKFELQNCADLSKLYQSCRGGFKLLKSVEFTSLPGMLRDIVNYQLLNIAQLQV